MNKFYDDLMVLFPSLDRKSDRLVKEFSYFIFSVKCEIDCFRHPCRLQASKRKTTAKENTTLNTHIRNAQFSEIEDAKH